MISTPANMRIVEIADLIERTYQQGQRTRHLLHCRRERDYFFWLLDNTVDVRESPSFPIRMLGVIRCLLALLAISGSALHPAAAQGQPENPIYPQVDYCSCEGAKESGAALTREFRALWTEHIASLDALLNWIENERQYTVTIKSVHGKPLWAIMDRRDEDGYLDRFLRYADEWSQTIKIVAMTYTKLGEKIPGAVQSIISDMNYVKKHARRKEKMPPERAVEILRELHETTQRMGKDVKNLRAHYYCLKVLPTELALTATLKRGFTHACGEKADILRDNVRQVYEHGGLPRRTWKMGSKSEASYIDQVNRCRSLGYNIRPQAVNATQCPASVQNDADADCSCTVSESVGDEAQGCTSYAKFHDNAYRKVTFYIVDNARKSKGWTKPDDWEGGWTQSCDYVREYQFDYCDRYCK